MGRRNNQERKINHGKKIKTTEERKNPRQKIPCQTRDIYYSKQTMYNVYIFTVKGGETGKGRKIQNSHRENFLFDHFEMLATCFQFSFFFLNLLKHEKTKQDVSLPPSFQAGLMNSPASNPP